MCFFIKKTFKSLDNKGFTLIELIISVGTLALVGVLSILFFMSSKDIGIRTNDLDQGLYHSNYIIESIKANLWDNKPLEDFKIKNKDDKSTTLIAFYDKDWNFVDNKDESSLFEFLIEFKEESINKDKILYSYNIEIKRLNPYFRMEEKTPLIYRLESKIYTTPLEEVIKK